VESQRPTGTTLPSPLPKNSFINTVCELSANISDYICNHKLGHNFDTVRRLLSFFFSSNNELGSVSVISCEGRKIPTEFGPLEKADLVSIGGSCKLI
jgi:hypothetical protein